MWNFRMQIPVFCAVFACKIFGNSTLQLRAVAKSWTAVFCSSWTMQNLLLAVEWLKYAIDVCRKICAVA
jgi:hypothetical protein